MSDKKWIPCYSVSLLIAWVLCGYEPLLYHELMDQSGIIG